VRLEDSSSTTSRKPVLQVDLRRKNPNLKKLRLDGHCFLGPRDYEWFWHLTAELLLTYKALVGVGCASAALVDEQKH
jgi:hypothetical protein